MAKRVFLAESDGTQFESKADAIAHDEEVFSERRNDTFQEKVAVFISETDYDLSQSPEGAEASAELLAAIRDNPLPFMEVMETILPKQWQRKLKLRRDGPPTKKSTKKKSAKKRGKSKATKPKDKPAPDPLEKEPTVDDVQAEILANIADAPEEMVKEAARAGQAVNLGWVGVMLGKTPPPPTEETPPAAFEELTEASDPPATEVPKTPPPPPEEISEDLTPLPDMGEEEESWRSDDEAIIPVVD